jgi:hypothetical protein
MHFFIRVNIWGNTVGFNRKMDCVMMRASGEQDCNEMELEIDSRLDRNYLLDAKFP